MTKFQGWSPGALRTIHHLLTKPYQLILNYLRLALQPREDIKKLDFRLSLSALHAVSKELSEPIDPDAEAVATDWPVKATHGISDAPEGPWFNRKHIGEKAVAGPDLGEMRKIVDIDKKEDHSLEGENRKKLEVCSTALTTEVAQQPRRA